MGRPHKCPYCSSTQTVSKGVRKTKTMGVRMLKRCKACGRKFTPKHQPESLEARNPKEPDDAATNCGTVSEAAQATSAPPVEATAASDRPVQSAPKPSESVIEQDPEDGPAD